MPERSQAGSAGRREVVRPDPVTAADVLTWRIPALTHLAQHFTFLGSEVVVGGLALPQVGRTHRPGRAGAVLAVGVAAGRVYLG